MAGLGLSNAAFLAVAAGIAMLATTNAWTAAHHRNHSAMGAALGLAYWALLIFFFWQWYRAATLS